MPAVQRPECWPPWSARAGRARGGRGRSGGPGIWQPGPRQCPSMARTCSVIAGVGRYRSVPSCSARPVSVVDGEPAPDRAGGGDDGAGVFGGDPAVPGQLAGRVGGAGGDLERDHDPRGGRRRGRGAAAARAGLPAPRPGSSRSAASSGTVPVARRRPRRRRGSPSSSAGVVRCPRVLTWARGWGTGRSCVGAAPRRPGRSAAGPGCAGRRRRASRGRATRSVRGWPRSARRWC